MPSEPPPLPPPPGPSVPPPPGPPLPPPPGPSLPPPGPSRDPASAAGDLATPRRLHPASVVLGIPLFQSLQALIFPIFLAFTAGRLVTSLLLGAFLLVGLPIRVALWRARTYSFDGEVLRVDAGILQRSHRSLDVARIQQVEIQRALLHRLLGLAALRIETAGSASEPEVDLHVVTEAEAVALRAAVRASQAAKAATRSGDTAIGAGATGHLGAVSVGDPSSADDASDTEVLRVPMTHVALAAVTGARLLVLPAVIGAAFQFAGQQFDAIIGSRLESLVIDGLDGALDTGITGPSWQLVTVVVLVVLGLTVATAVVTGLLRDGNFRMVLRDGDLHVSRGLLSTQESVLPLQRVQLVQVQRNVLRRALGYSTVRIRSAGGSTGGDGSVAVPLLPDAEVAALLAHVLPGTDDVPALVSHPRGALRRAILRWVRSAAAITAVLWAATLLVPFLDVPLAELGRWLSLGLLPAAVALGVVEYRHLAHGSTQRVVVARTGALSLVTTLAPVVKVQAVSRSASFFQRRLGLATLTAHVAGPGASVAILDADAADADRLHGWLTEHAAAPLPRTHDRPAASLPASG